ncbi:MAG: hypothetical protein U0K34_12630 [Ruminococcus sp.]|jgi:hypothetical protein|nr:hypothetical protein [Ruminococcus sp.]DAO64358.1 MAG TPA: hypothetical protein [Caudoviricetes sp.]
MIKFANIGDFKVAQNFGYLKTPAVLENGMAVTYDLKTKAVALPTAITAKQAGLAVVMNRIDKPETLTPNDYRIEVGEFPRIFTLASLAGHLFDMDDAVVTTAYNTLAVGDKLVVGTDGKWAKSADVSDYAEYLEIVEKTSFGGNGLRVVVHA